MQQNQIEQACTDLIEQRLYNSALFWLDKLLSFDSDSEEYLYSFLDCLLQTRQYFRAMSFSSARKIEKKSWRISLICVECYYETAEYDKAVSLLNDTNWPFNTKSMTNVNLLKGKVFEAKKDMTLAESAYEEAFKNDPSCHEALAKLMEFSKPNICGMINNCLLPGDIPDTYRLLYTAESSDAMDPPFVQNITQKSVDGMISSIQYLYETFMFTEAYNISVKVIATDMYNPHHLPYHVALLYKLSKEVELYSFTNKLIKANYELEITWYAIGVYYLLRRNTDKAREYFKVVTEKFPAFPYAWMCLGHTYSIECEHDHAISLYLTVANNCNKRALVSVAAEYFRLDNLYMASNILDEARKQLECDPQVVFETAIADYRRDRFEAALEGFERTRAICESRKIELRDEFWEPLFNNTGYCLRKLGFFERAIEAHRTSLIIRPSSSAYCALALNYCYLMDFKQAIGYLHNALSLSRNDFVVCHLLHFCIEVDAQIPLLDDFRLPLLDLNVESTLVKDIVSTNDISLTVNSPDVALE